MGFIAFLAGMTDHRTLALGGLLLSTLSSLSITVRYDNDWSWYTKPLYPSGVVLVIMAAMPAMTNTAIVAKGYGGDYKYAAMLTAVSTVLAVFAIPFYMWLVH